MGGDPQSVMAVPACGAGVTAHVDELAHSNRCECVAANTFARMGRALDEQHISSRLCEPVRGSATRWPATDDEHIAIECLTQGMALMAAATPAAGEGAAAEMGPLGIALGCHFVADRFTADHLAHISRDRIELMLIEHIAERGHSRGVIAAAGDVCAAGPVGSP